MFFRCLTSGLLALSIVLGSASTALALSTSLTVDSQSILMVDGIDANSTVDIMAFDLGTQYNFGYYDSGFVQILSATSMMSTYSFAGGAVVDFAIQDALHPGTVHKLSDSGAATLVFSSPNVDVWESLSITWNVGNGNNNPILSLSSGDGFVPSGSISAVASPIPEPTAALTFAVGLWVTGFGVRRQLQA